MELLNDDLFKPFKDDEIENLDAIMVRGGEVGETGAHQWTDGAGHWISCSSDSHANGEVIAGYDCTCSNTNTGSVGPC